MQGAICFMVSSVRKWVYSIIEHSMKLPWDRSVLALVGYFSDNCRGEVIECAGQLFFSVSRKLNNDHHHWFWGINGTCFFVCCFLENTWSTWKHKWYWETRCVFISEDFFSMLNKQKVFWFQHSPVEEKCFWILECHILFEVKCIVKFKFEILRAGFKYELVLNLIEIWSSFHA